MSQLLQFPLSAHVAAISEVESLLHVEAKALPPEEALAVLRGNTVATVSLWDIDGRMVASRELYAMGNASVYVASSRRLARLFSADHLPVMELDVSDIDGLAVWRYAWVRGRIRTLQPTSIDEERREWYAGIEHLCRASPTLRSVEEFKLANFGIIKLDDVTVAGMIVPLD